MKAYITKWALTQGILEVEVSEQTGKSVFWGCGYMASAYGEGNQWHKCRDKAVFRAQQMKVDKIISLKRQIAKLEAMTFK